MQMKPDYVYLSHMTILLYQIYRVTNHPMTINQPTLLIHVFPTSPGDVVIPQFIVSACKLYTAALSLIYPRQVQILVESQTIIV